MQQLKKEFLCMANSWHAKEGQSVHPTVTVSTGTRIQSTAAADSAYSNRPHKTEPGHYHSVLCTCVHIINEERQRGVSVRVYMAGYLRLICGWVAALLHCWCVQIW